MNFVPLAALMAAHVAVASLTHIVARIALAREGVPAEVVTTLRAAVAFTVLAASWLVVRRPEGRPPLGRRDAVMLLLLMALAVPLNQFLYLIALRHAPAVHGALLFCLTPLFVGALETFAGRHRTTREAWLGAVLAVTGVVLVLGERGLAFAPSAIRGDLILLGSVVAWSLYTFLGRPFLSRYSNFELSRLSLMGGALLLFPLTAAPTLGFPFARLSTSAILAILYLGLVTSVVAYVLWTTLLRRVGAVRVSILTTLQPVATGILGWAFLDERVGTRFVAGGFIVLTGVLMVQLGDFRARRRGGAAGPGTAPAAGA